MISINGMTIRGRYSPSPRKGNIMLKLVSGNILTPNLEERGVIVCHQVNCLGVMGAGLALQIKKMHPGVYKNYRDKCRQIAGAIGGLGDVQFCSVIADAGYIIANVFGQYGYGRDKQYTDYDALRKAFQQIAMSFPTYTVRIPYLMGCGLGGGNWDIVYQIIEETLDAAGVAVEIWKLH